MELGCTAPMGAHMGPIWVPYRLLAGSLASSKPCNGLASILGKLLVPQLIIYSSLVLILRVVHEQRILENRNSITYSSLVVNE